MWWTEKYKLPSNHELFTGSTLFDLLVEYQLDQIRKNPLEAHRNEDGQVQFKNTGDDLIDRWEQQIASGFTPNMEDAFAPGELAKIKQRLRRASGGKPMTFGDTTKYVGDKLNSDASELNPFNTFGDK